MTLAFFRSKDLCVVVVLMHVLSFLNCIGRSFPEIVDSISKKRKKLLSETEPRKRKSSSAGNIYLYGTRPIIYFRENRVNHQASSALDTRSRQLESNLRHIDSVIKENERSSGIGTGLQNHVMLRMLWRIYVARLSSAPHAIPAASTLASCNVLRQQ